MAFVAPDRADWERSGLLIFSLWFILLGFRTWAVVGYQEADPAQGVSSRRTQKVKRHTRGRVTWKWAGVTKANQQTHKAACVRAKSCLSICATDRWRIGHGIRRRAGLVVLLLLLLLLTTSPFRREPSPWAFHFAAALPSATARRTPLA